MGCKNSFRQPRHGFVAAAQAFTIIELLVVVSIIALLMSIMIPALSHAKLVSASSVCMSRIKGLQTAMATYLAEYDNTFPINGLLMPKSGVPQMYQNPAGNKFLTSEVTDQQKWRLEYGALWKYMGGGELPSPMPNPAYLPAPSGPLARAFLCPSDSLRRTNPASGPGKAPLTLQPEVGGGASVQVGFASPGYWSYSVNAVLNSLGRLRDNPIFPKNTIGETVLPWNDPLKATNIHNPGNFIYFMEEDESSLFNDEVFEPPTFRDFASNTERLSNRHNGAGNIGFGDGHVEPFNEIAFDNNAVHSPVTGLFFPDGGEFLP